jgi:hypothetical protein
MTWPRSSRPVRRPLREDLIVDTALELLGKGDLESVSMRRDQVLGTASLYAHAANKAEPHEPVLDRPLATIPHPRPIPAAGRSSCARWRGHSCRTGPRAGLRHTRAVVRGARGRGELGVDLARSGEVDAEEPARRADRGLYGGEVRGVREPHHAGPDAGVHTGRGAVRVRSRRVLAGLAAIGR